MKSRWILALLTGVLGAALCGGTVLAKTQAAPTTTIFGKASFDEFDLMAHARTADQWRARLKTRGLSDLYVVDNKFAAGAETGWHSHPGPSLILVVQGSVTNYSSDNACAPRVYTAPAGFIDAGGKDVHLLRNESGAPAETIAVQLLPKDAVRKTDAAAPDGCP